MKKLLAIFLSVLLLCAMIPSATAFAAEEPTIVVSDYVANPGDEIQIAVKLLNNPGVIAATVEIQYDKNVMELVTYYDEDEEVDLNMIEVASGWNSKYITFGPPSRCIVSFIYGTAKKNVDNEDFFTATFKIKDDAAAGTYPLTVKYDPANFFNVEMKDVYFGAQNGSITINGAACEHEYDDEYDADCNLCGDIREVPEKPSYIPGDVNGDGRVNNKDLGRLQQYLGDWDVTLVQDAADNNNDGRINNKDLGRLQQYLSDWDVTLL